MGRKHRPCFPPFGFSFCLSLHPWIQPQKTPLGRGQIVSGGDKPQNWGTIVISIYLVLFTSVRMYNSSLAFQNQLRSFGMMNTELLSSLASIGLSNVDKTSKECEHPVQFSEIDIYTDKFVHVFYYHLIFEQTISHLDTVRSFIHDTEIESLFRDSVKEVYKAYKTYCSNADCIPLPYQNFRDAICEILNCSTAPRKMPDGKSVRCFVRKRGQK